MPPKKSGSDRVLRPRTPPPSAGGATPATPASGAGAKRKASKGSSTKKAKKGKGTPTRSLAKTFDKTGDDGSDQGQKSPEDPPREGTPDVQGEPVPEDPIWKHLEAAAAADENPLLKQLAVHLREAKQREDALRRELYQQAQDAAAKQAVRDFEEKGVSAFHFNADDVKRALDKFVVPCMFEDSARQFYSQLQVTMDTQDSVTRAFSSVTKLPKSHRNKIFQRRLRDS